jgi:hypothetical protein
MKSLVRSIGTAGAVLLLAGAQNVGAQIIDTVEFTTLFPFTAGNAKLPAGTYSIRPDEDNPQILELTGAHTAALVEAQSTQAGRPSSKTDVVFKRFGNVYVLKSVWVEGSSEGATIILAEGEKHAARQQGVQGEAHVAGRKKSAASTNR